MTFTKLLTIFTIEGILAVMNLKSNCFMKNSLNKEDIYYDEDLIIIIPSVGCKGMKRI